MPRKRVFYTTIILCLAVFLAGSGLLFAQTFEDSNIFTLTTGGGAGQGLYTLYCSGSSTSTITVAWTGNVSGSHGITLYHSTSPSGILGGSREVLAPPPTLATSTGAYTHTGLDTGSQHYYLLSWSGSQPGSSNVANCQAGRTVGDSPNNPYVWALSSDTLYYTWKDNAVRPHTFILERIKLTPLAPVFTNPKVQALSDSQIRLTWRNQTNTQQYKGPYYHLFERSTSPTFPTGSVTTVRKAFPEDVLRSATRIDYNTIDSGLTEATDYYYRLRGCSFLRVDLANELPPTVANRIDSPTEAVCGLYQSGENYVATTTLPRSPSNLQFSNVSHDSLTFTFTDNSSRESGFQVRVTPCPSGLSCSGGTATYNLGAAVNPPNTVSDTISGLSPDTSYTVSVRSFYDSAVGGRVYSQSAASNSVITDIELVTSAGSGGSINPNCPSASPCYYDYNTQTQVDITATASTTYQVSSLTGCDSQAQGIGTNRATCTITTNGNKNVNTTFATSSGAFNSPPPYAWSGRNLAANILDPIVETIKNFKILKIIDGVTSFLKSIQLALAQVQRESIEGITVSDEELDNYFQQFVVDGRTVPSPTIRDGLRLSVYQDTGLEPGTVYLYRVKAVYTDAGSPTSSPYAAPAAGRTLPAGTVLPTVTTRVCVRNNLCGQTTGVPVISNGVPYNPDAQCSVNADCRDVGTSRQVFEETR